VSRGNTDESKRLNKKIHLEILPSIRKTGGYNAFANQSVPSAVRYTESASMLEAMLKMTSLLSVPVHIAQQESAKAVDQTYGVGCVSLLKFSDAQNNIPASEEMLEPTDLAKRLGIKSGIEMNKKLAEWGFQTRVNDAWELTKAGELIATKHAWTRGAKTGYNLKWNVAEIQKLTNQKLAA
jgi:hypothetical protein